MTSNPNYNREQKLKRRFGLSLEDFNRMLAEQEGKCGICQQYRALVVDHCHTRNVVRGLLCSHCNTAIGLLGENLSTLQGAITYLNTHNQP